MDGFYFSLLGKWSYLGLFLVLLAAGMGVPLPEDIPLLAAGWLVHRGQADLYLMILTGLIGVMVGDSIIFSAGRRYGAHIVEHRWLRRIAKPWLLEKARQKYEKHGAKILFAARFMPGLRAVLFLTAGICRVPFWKFFVIDGFAALISVPVWVVVGYKFSDYIHEIVGGTRTATIVIASVFIAGLIGWGCWEYYRHIRKKNREALDAKKVLEEVVRTAPLVTDTRPRTEQRETAATAVSDE